MGTALGSIIILFPKNIFTTTFLIIALFLIFIGIITAIFSWPKFMISPLFKDSPSLFADPKEIENYLENIRKRTNNWTYQNVKKKKNSTINKE